LQHSPILGRARCFDTLTMRVLKEDNLTFLEALILAALFFESP
jgi:hypothetical protein